MNERSRLGKSIIATLICPAFIAGIGSAVVVIPVTILGSIIFLITAILSAINEFRSCYYGNQTLHISSDSQTAREGWIGFIADRFESPGFATFIQGVVYIYTALVSLFSGDFFRSVIFIVFAIGEGAGTAIVNKTYTPKTRTLLWLEIVFIKMWKRFGNNIQTVLKDPGAAFSFGNVALILIDFNFHILPNHPNMSVVFFVGFAFALVGVARGLSPLLRQKKMQPSGSASLLAGIGDILLGSSTIIFGNPYTGVATIIWGISNIFYGKKVGSHFLQKLFQR